MVALSCAASGASPAQGARITWDCLGTSIRAASRLLRCFRGIAFQLEEYVYTSYEEHIFQLLTSDHVKQFAKIIEICRARE